MTILKFQHGEIKYDPKPKDKWSYFTVNKGKFQCESCGIINSVVLPVFGIENQPPTNFVCSKCRGLLKEI